MLDAIKSANIANNILILKDLFYLEGVVAHGRASSSLAFAPVFSEARNHFRLRAFLCSRESVARVCGAGDGGGRRQDGCPGDVRHQQPGARVLEQLFLRG